MPKENIKDTLQTGVVAREAGDYQSGTRLLEAAFNQALQENDSELAIEAGNNYAIQLRLSAGRFVRQDKLKQAKQVSQESLQVYQTLKQAGLLNYNHPSTARNTSHALLYAGHIKEAIPQLQKSAQLQEDLAAQGDEYCHLAAAYLGTNQLQQSKESLSQGLQLIKEHQGHPIWHTFALMTKATIQSKNNQPEKAIQTLNQALQLAKEEDLSVRLEEIEFLLNQDPDKINVLSAVAVPA